MNKPTKFTFKNAPKATGLARAASLGEEVTIKLNKQHVGTIRPPVYHLDNHVWSIALSVKCEPTPDAPNRNWKWITLKAKFNTADEAKTFLNEKFELITSTYDLAPRTM